MPFDGKVSDYTKVAPPAPVFDKDNPPTRMSDAIRMAVADIEAQERAGIAYDWNNCARCTAGAVVRRLGRVDDWEGFGAQWRAVLGCLSHVSVGWKSSSVYEQYGNHDRIHGSYWRAAGFTLPRNDVPLRISAHEADPIAFKRDMLALADRLEAEGS